MIAFDEEEFGLIYSSRTNARRTMPNAALLSSRGTRGTPYFGTYMSDARPTKAEARKQLEFLTIPFRVGAPFAPPHIKPVLVGAPRLAEFLIEIDPQDRFRE